MVEYSGSGGGSINYSTGNGSITNAKFLANGNVASFDTLRSLASGDWCEFKRITDIEVSIKMSKILTELSADLSEMIEQMTDFTTKMQKIDEEICSYDKQI